MLTFFSRPETVIRRFPLIFVGCFIAALSLWMATEFALDIIDQDEQAMSEQTAFHWMRIAMATGLFCLWGVAATLAFETQKSTQKSASSPRLLHNITLLILAMIAVGYYFWLPILPDVAPGIHFPRFLAAVLFSYLLIIILSVRKGELWESLYHVILRTIMTGIVGGLIMYALFLALFAVNFFFGLDLSEAWFARIAIVIWAIIAPWFFLSGLPTGQHSGPPHTQLTRHTFLKVLALYIGLPVAGIYLAILYAFMGKILLTMTWPEEGVVWYIFALTLMSVTSLTANYVFGDTARMRKILRLFWILLLPLMVIYFIAIGIRIQEYGLTEPRILIVVFGIWFTLSALWYMIRGVHGVRLLLVSFVIIGVITIFTPALNLFHISVHDQTGRLFQHLEDANMIDSEGKITKESADIDPETERSIGSIFRFLSQRGALEKNVMKHVHSDIYEEMKGAYDDVTSIDDWMLGNILDIDLYAIPPTPTNQSFPDIQYSVWDKGNHGNDIIPLPSGATHMLQVDYYHNDGISSYRGAPQSPYRSENGALIITLEGATYSIYAESFLDAFSAWNQEDFLTYTLGSTTLIIHLENFYARYDESKGGYILQNWSGKVFFIDSI